MGTHPDLPTTWSTTENVEWAAEVPGVGWSSPIVWGNRIFLTAATSPSEMKGPSLGTDFSNDYIAELQAQGLPPEEVNRRLYARDRELPEEVEIGLHLFVSISRPGKRSGSGSSIAAIRSEAATGRTATPRKRR